MRRKRVILLSLFSSVTFILSCGERNLPPSESSPSPSQPIESYSESEVGIIISPEFGGNTLQSQSFRLKKLQSDAEFRVEIISSDSSGTVIEKKIIPAGAQVPVSVRVRLSKDGGSLTISATADGYNKATKSFRYNNPTKVKNIKVELSPSPVETQIVDIQQGITITSEGQRYVRFAIFRNPQGLTKLAIGEMEIKKQDNGEKLLDVTIPLDKLQSGVQSLKVQYKDFKPSNPEDYKNFPAEETTDGRKLISFGFDYLNIVDQNGNNPFITQSSQGLRATLFTGEYYRILRYVDCEQINEMKNAGILQDEDPSKGGIQFTFYAFDREQGGWIEAGQGIFVSSNTVNYEELGEDSEIVDTVWDYIIQNGCIDDTPCNPNDPVSSACIDVNGDGILEDVSCSGNSVITDVSSICQNGSGWVVVSVTNPALEWKNLDYVVPAQEQVCCDFKITDEIGNPIGNAYVYVNPTGNIEWTEGITDAEGNITLCTLKHGDVLTGELYIYNPYTWNYTIQSIDFSNCLEQIVITNPQKCKVEGKVVYDNDNPATNAYVEVYNSSYSTYTWDYTDSNGTYSISTPCNTSLFLRVNFSETTYSFNVNGIKNDDETNDDGTVVQLKDYILQNNPPEGYAYAWDYTVKTGESVNITVCAWDWEGDYPISYSTAIQGQGQLNPSSGQINSSEWCKDIVYTAPDIAGNVILDFTFTDSAGKQSTDSITLTVTPQNSPPVGYLYGTVGYDGNSNSYIYDIFAYFYDEDGDTVNWSITNDCGATTTEATSGSADRSGNVSATFTSPNNSCSFTLNLNDGVNTTTETSVLTYINQIPSVSLWAEPGIYVPQGTTSVKIYSYIYDDDTDWTCEWKENDNVNPNSTSCSSHTLDLSNAKPGEYNVQLCVTDPANNTGCGSITIYYGIADAEIVIQNK